MENHYQENTLVFQAVEIIGGAPDAKPQFFQPPDSSPSLYRHELSGALIAVAGLDAKGLA
jgi:hypothetical protein